MPFSATTPEHTAAYWDNFFSKFVKPSVERLHYGCRRSKAEPSNIIKDILKELYDADLVLAVLTDFNANVWYELGIRHALRRGTIMTIEEGQELPFDISHYGVIKYEDTIAGGATDFEEKLRSFVRRIEVEKPADSAVSEFLGAQGRVVKGKRKVLWVDDYPLRTEAVIEIYRLLGVEFDLALNTAQALDFLEMREYDLVISDMVRGPWSDAGVRLIRYIKRRFATPPPILVFTDSSTVKHDGRRVKKEGAALVTASTRELLRKMTEVLNL